MDKNITLTEYSYIFIGKENEGKNKAIDKKTFEEIESFVLKNSENVQFLKIGQNKKHKYIKAQNYVGLIQTHSGTTVEILPKISKGEDEIKEKEVLIKMLKTLRNSPFKAMNIVRLKRENLPLFEIFISMFLEELSILLKNGIRSDYIKKEENLRYLKGKLKLGEQVQRNFIHKDRFYVEYDEFSRNRLENRIIKTTLEYLYKKTKTNKNKKRIREFLFVFDGISSISTYKEAFKTLKINRQMKYYEKLLGWCRIFLLGNSLSPYRGEDLAFALLFDMNMLFENYVGEYLKKKIKNLKLQDRKYHLAYSSGRGRFQLKPDIVMKKSGQIIICDTKWKVIDEEPAQSDMYQLYAYGTKYKDCRNLYLIYPEIPRASGISYDFYKDSSLKLNVIYFDLVREKFIDEKNIDFLKLNNT